jgi:hypothetical protein
MVDRSRFARPPADGDGREPEVLDVGGRPRRGEAAGSVESGVSRRPERYGCGTGSPRHPGTRSRTARSRQRWTAALIVAAVLGAVAYRDGRPAGDEAEVVGVVEAYTDAWNEQDIPRLLTILNDGGTFAAGEELRAPNVGPSATRSWSRSWSGSSPGSRHCRRSAT